MRWVKCLKLSLALGKHHTIAGHYEFPQVSGSVVDSRDTTVNITHIETVPTQPSSQTSQGYRHLHYHMAGVWQGSILGRMSNMNIWFLH